MLTIEEKNAINKTIIELQRALILDQFEYLSIRAELLGWKPSTLQAIDDYINSAEVFECVCDFIHCDFEDGYIYKPERLRSIFDFTDRETAEMILYQYGKTDKLQRLYCDLIHEAQNNFGTDYGNKLLKTAEDCGVYDLI